jgi:hypothetical protein
VECPAKRNMKVSQWQCIIYYKLTGIANIGNLWFATYRKKETLYLARASNENVIITSEK